MLIAILSSFLQAVIKYTFLLSLKFRSFSNGCNLMNLCSIFLITVVEYEYSKKDVCVILIDLLAATVSKHVRSLSKYKYIK